MSAQGTAERPPSPLSLPSLPSLPSGYHAIHPDVSLNFQMNRWFGLVGDVSMLDEMRTVAPMAQFYKQIAALTNTRSLTARLFTQAESAQNHCQAGNFGVGAWAAEGRRLQRARNRHRRVSPPAPRGQALGLSVLPGGTRFSHVSLRRLLPPTLLALQVITAWLDSQAAHGQRG